MRRRFRATPAATAAALLLLAACGGSGSANIKSDGDGDGGSTTTGGGGSATGGSGTGATGGSTTTTTTGTGGNSAGGGGGDVGGQGQGGVGGGMLCAPGSTQSCYSGPAGTEGVGLCKGGNQQCNGSGTAWGPCAGEVLPAAETCATAGDDDCDGQTNEEGAGCSCAPGSTQGCYSGPPATQNVGTCKGGTQTCNAQGTGYGPCVGEVVPAVESCATPVDEDCDGQVNDGCVCAPNTTANCYTGPAGTVGVGQCKEGVATCNAQGTAWGPCLGQVLPSVEICATPVDEDCDGQSGCPVDQATVDLRADNNRNGTVDLADPTEDAGENTWDATHGAVFLANIDDDQNACPTANQTDAQLAACHDADATDTAINGPDDLLDLARLETVPWPGAPADSYGTIALSAPGASNVRMFKKVGASFVLFNPASDQLTPAELQAGVELAIEGKDIVRNDAVWDGLVDVTFHVHGGTGQNGPIPDGNDVVRMRMAPLVFRHHLDEAQSVYATKINNNAGSTAFRADLTAACTASGVPNPLVELTVSDQWTQDFFETAYMSMPAPNGGQQIIHVNVRSANFTGTLRSAGKVVYTVLRGKDKAGLTQYDPNHPNGMDTLNSFGNLETIPPYTWSGQSWPLGRVLRGSTPSFYPDTSFDLMVQSQGVQPIVYIDTEWLLVGHVDETTSFIKAASPRGWVLLLADPTLAKNMLLAQQGNGNGGVQMFVGKFWTGNVPAVQTINQVLADPDVMNESAWAATQIDGQLTTLEQQTGLTNAEVVKVPVLFDQQSGYSVAYQPGTVNGIYLSDTDFGPPTPHGPVIGGVDIFEQQLEQALAPYGVTVHWIEDWDLYHRLDGEVHCGSNTTRVVPATQKWWESGL